MKAELSRLGADNFEALIQALMSGIFGYSVKIYGDGRDGQREAVIENADCVICGGARAQGRTIVQAKYKSPDGDEDNWSWLRRNLKSELDGFREKAKTRPDFIPRTWLFFTNLTLTPVLDDGLKDKADAFVKGYTDLIPHIFVLGADEIRAMLDNNRDVARRYAAFLTPGDVLEDAMSFLREMRNEKLEALLEYLRKMFREDSAVRLEQTGSVRDNKIDIRRVYTDLEASAPEEAQGETVGLAAFLLALGNRPQRRGRRGETPDAPGDTAGRLVLLGDAGRGKSTLCQYVCQLYRAALLRRFHVEEPGVSEYFTDETLPAPACERFPILIRLKNYAKWLAERGEEDDLSVLAYCRYHIRARASVEVGIPELRQLLVSYSWIFFFDGLDEVPASSNRSEVLGQIQSFLERDLRAADCDALVVCTSRPQGYDESFSRRSFRHMVLRDMSPDCCRRYIDRLLALLEENAEERERCRAVLEGALADATTAKLMTTPLYTAILVLLVKTGSTPPKRRFDLFEEYCRTVVKREQQKAMLPVLYEGEGEPAWIVGLHAAIAYRLQRESESAENAAAELDAAACRELIAAYLAEDGWEGDRAAMSERLYTALTRRLPFLAEAPGADGERHVLFPLRSMQEYFAAQQILTCGEEEQRALLETLSLSAYWRMVFLFVAGYYSKEAARRRNMCDILYMICLRGNGDDAFPNPDREACTLTLAGSRLALDLLGDDLFVHRGGQGRYLALAAELLSWKSFESSSPVPAFRKLPEALCKRLLHEHWREIRSADESAFLLLWELAAKGDAEARAALEALADTASPPSFLAFDALLEIGAEGLGARMLARAFQWSVQGDWLYLHFNSFAPVLRFWKQYCARGQLSLLPLTARRRVFCWVIAKRILITSDSDSLAELAETDTLLERLRRTAFFPYREPVRDAAWDARYIPIWPELPENPLIAPLREAGMAELAALFAFLDAPSAARLAALLCELEGLPERYREDILAVMERANWLLRRIARRLRDVSSPDALLAEYDEAALSACRAREGRIIEALRSHDFSALTGERAWGELGVGGLPEEDFMALCRIAENAAPEELDDICYVLYFCRLSEEHSLPRSLALRRFPDMLRTWSGAKPALDVFAASSPAALLPGRLRYPDRIVEYNYYFGNNAQKVLMNIRALVSLGGDCLDAYALILWVCRTDCLDELRGMADAAAAQYCELRARGNGLALLGCLLAVLTKPLPPALLPLLREDAGRLLPEEWWLLRNSVDCFSLEGILVVYHVAEALDWDADKKADFLSQCRAAMLAALESRPTTAALDRAAEAPLLPV